MARILQENDKLFLQLHFVPLSFIQMDIGEEKKKVVRGIQEGRGLRLPFRILPLKCGSLLMAEFSSCLSSSNTLINLSICKRNSQLHRG